MKKNSLVRVVSMALVLCMAVVPFSVFAEELPTQENGNTKTERNHVERKDGQGKEIRLEQVAEHTPENYDLWAELFENHENLKAIKDELKEQFEMIKEMRKEEGKNNFADLKLQVENEEITREEAKEIIDSFKADRKEKMEDRKEEIASEREYVKGLHETKRELNGQIKEAIESGDTSNVATLLNQILEINLELESHFEEMIEMMEERLQEINMI